MCLFHNSKGDLGLPDLRLEVFPQLNIKSCGRQTDVQKVFFLLVYILLDPCCNLTMSSTTAYGSFWACMSDGGDD